MKLPDEVLARSRRLSAAAAARILALADERTYEVIPGAIEDDIVGVVAQFYHYRGGRGMLLKF